MPVRVYAHTPHRGSYGCDRCCLPNPKDETISPSSVPWSPQQKGVCLKTCGPKTAARALHSQRIQKVRQPGKLHHGYTMLHTHARTRTRTRTRTHARSLSCTMMLVSCGEMRGPHFLLARRRLTEQHGTTQGQTGTW